MVCLAFGGVYLLVSGRSQPRMPEPTAVPVSPEVGGEPEAVPDPATSEWDAVPELPEPSAPTPSPQGPVARQRLTEELFIEISARMLVAADEFPVSEVGQRSFERVCEGILEAQRVSRADFERMEAEIAQDTKRQAAVVDRVLERADQLRQPTGIQVRPSPGPTVDPSRQPRRAPGAAIPPR